MRSVFRSCLLVICGVATLGLLSTASARSSDDVPSCRQVERGCTRAIAGSFARATNEFDKFKWDFKRELENLGEMPAQEDVDALVEFFCEKIEIRGSYYTHRIEFLEDRCRMAFMNCECPRRGGCATGHRNNVVRRAFSYRSLIRVAVKDCCDEIEAMADDMMSP